MDCKLPVNENMVSPSLIKVHPAADAEDEKTDAGRLREEMQPSTALQTIAEWVSEKNKTEEIRSQWCYIVAVIDRLVFIVLISLSVSVIIALSS